MSKKPTHVNILGVDIPLLTIAYCTSTVPGPMIEDWNNYCNFSEFAKYTTFDELAERLGIS